MKIPSKKNFYEHMSSIYGKYNDTTAYRTLLDIFDRAEDIDLMNELYELTDYNKKQRLQYRYGLACVGKEFTPLQVDQYISIIEYAMENMEI